MARSRSTASTQSPSGQRTQSRKIKAGLRRARAAGVTLGRPPLEFDLERAFRLQKRGASIRDIARKLGVAKSTVADRLSAYC